MSNNEGMRRSHFQKRVNRILYCTENANHITEFSFVLCLRPRVYGLQHQSYLVTTGESSMLTPRLAVLLAMPSFFPIQLRYDGRRF
jgi:hypothetical protein